MPFHPKNFPFPAIYNWEAMASFPRLNIIRTPKQPLPRGTKGFSLPPGSPQDIPLARHSRDFTPPRQASTRLTKPGISLIKPWYKPAKTGFQQYCNKYHSLYYSRRNPPGTRRRACKANERDAGIPQEYSRPHNEARETTGGNYPENKDSI